MNNKFGWSLPPGCSSSDIPGNRPEDIVDEQIHENIENALRPIVNLTHNVSDEVFDNIIEQITQNVFKLINNAHESGYAQCQNDVDEARSYAALEHADDARLDDSPKRCPECETPNQFGELCEKCGPLYGETRGEEHAP